MFVPGKWLAFALAAIHTFLSPAPAQNATINIDNTCTTCFCRVNDSINVHHRRALRINQVGFLPDQARKTAFAAVSDGGTYQVIPLRPSSRLIRAIWTMKKEEKQ